MPTHMHIYIHASYSGSKWVHLDTPTNVTELNCTHIVYELDFVRINLDYKVGWFVVFYVPSTERLFRDGTPVYCPLRRT